MKKTKEINLIMTGGHAKGAALATFQEITKRKKSWKIYFLGSASSFEGKNISTLESELFPKLGIKYYAVYTGRVQRKFTRYTIPALLKIPVGFLHSYKLLSEIKPSVVLSFGGFSAFPVVVIAKLLKVPIIIHEQTAVVGRANRYSYFFADKIAISRETSRAYFPDRKIVLTGNPVSDNVLRLKPKTMLGNTPTIFITAGQTGSVAINNVIENSLLTLLSKYKIIHQTGKFQFDKFRDLKATLDKNLQYKYVVFSVAEPDLSNYLNKCDIVVSRAGANTVSELMVLKIPSVLIPLPIAYLDEQKQNAKYAEKYGIATIIEQDNLTPKILLSTLNNICGNYSKITESVRFAKTPDTKASVKLVDLIELVLHE